MLDVVLVGVVLCASIAAYAALWRFSMDQIAFGLEADEPAPRDAGKLTEERER